MQRLLVFSVMATVGSAVAKAETLGGDALREFVAGKVVHLDSPFGTIPITYNENGTMAAKASGLALTAYLGATSDRG